MGRVRPYKIDPPKGGKEKKKEKIKIGQLSIAFKMLSPWLLLKLTCSNKLLIIG